MAYYKKSSKKYYDSHRQQRITNSKKWAKENPEKKKAYDQKRYQQKREHLVGQAKAFREKYPEKIKERVKKSYLNHRKKRIKESIEWKKNNPEKAKAHKRKYYKKHRVECNTRMKKYNQSLWGYAVCQVISNKKNSHKHHAMDIYTNNQWFNMVIETGGYCFECGKKVGFKKLTIDHIFPLSLAENLYDLTGQKIIYTINDIQPMCKPCNSKKGDKI